ncbi:MAG TPA: hypothetical protein VF228_17390 [Iamia sp.]
MSTTTPADSTTIDFLTDVEWTHPEAIELIGLARNLGPDAENGRAVAIAVAAKKEWGVGDELTSEAHRRLILTAERYGTMQPEWRAKLIEVHRLDDLCPLHLLDADRDGVFRCCDEEDA